VIYIELLASKLSLAFQESSKSFREEKNVKNIFFEVLQCVATMGGGLEETL
jgi:hypothetical protein